MRDECRWPGTSGRTGWFGCPSSSPTSPGRWRGMSSETEIRPFRVDMPDEAIADLQRRIAAARLPGQESEKERAALATFTTSGRGYFIEQATRPQTIGYALLDSPLALAAWLLDHDTDAYYKISRAFVDGQSSGGLTRDSVVDNITLYWLTGTGASAARSYWEVGQAAAHAAGQAPPEVKLPVGFTTFPGEVVPAPDR